jgi:hypothetical protein
MRTVQLDKNAGGKKLRDECNRQGVVQCVLLPPEVRDLSDPEVVEHGIRNGYLTLTFDRGLFVNSADRLVGRNPGLLLLRADDGSCQQVSTKTAPKLLTTFKKEFPDWNLAPWQNSIVELTPTLVFVYHTRSAPPVLMAILQRTDAGWQDKLKQLLEENARIIEHQ